MDESVGRHHLSKCRSRDPLGNAAYFPSPRLATHELSRRYLGQDWAAMNLSVAAKLLPILHQVFNSMNLDPFARPELDFVSSEHLPRK
jgi:hypothetical protein